MPQYLHKANVLKTWVCCALAVLLLAFTQLVFANTSATSHLGHGDCDSADAVLMQHAGHNGNHHSSDSPLPSTDCCTVTCAISCTSIVDAVGYRGLPSASAVHTEWLQQAYGDWLEPPETPPPIV